MFKKKKEYWQNPLKNSSSENLEVDKWEISEFVWKKLLPLVGFRPYPLDELMLMVSSVCLVRPTHIIEWGTHIGASARIFYETVKGFEIESEIFSFDLPDEEEHQEHPGNERGKMVKGFKGVHLFQEDALVKGIDLYLSDNNSEKTPLFYVDGDHEYDTVKNELAKISSKVPEANMLLHDTFNQSVDSGYNVGPHRAIEEFLKSTNLSYRVISTNLGLPGMTLLTPE